MELLFQKMDNLCTGFSSIIWNQQIMQARVDNSKNKWHKISRNIFSNKLFFVYVYTYEYNSERTITAETITGEKVHLRTSVANIQLIDKGLNIISTIDTHKLVDEIIIGRGFLEYFEIKLNGCKKELDIQVCEI